MDPTSWSNDEARHAFFAQLPRPLAVMLACDLAALVPQPPVGAAAIDCARRWIMGAAELREVRVAARAAAVFAPHTRHPAYAAAAAANTVHTGAAYLAHSGSWVCEAVRACAASGGVQLERVDYPAQSRRVAFLKQALDDPRVRLLIAASNDEPAARPILWDAMLDAGYTPQPTRPWSEDLV